MNLRFVFIVLYFLILISPPAFAREFKEVEAPVFNGDKFVEADREALEEAWTVLRDNYASYDLFQLFKQGNSPWVKNCMDSAHSLGTDIAQQCMEQGSSLDGWKIDTITTIEPCHDALMLRSPTTNKMYFFDGYLNDHRIVELREENGQFKAIEGEVLPDFRYCDRVSKEGKTTYEISLRAETSTTELGFPYNVLRGDPIPSSVHVECVASPDPPPSLEAGVQIPNVCVETSFEESEEFDVQTVSSNDPNEKVGPQGVGEDRYISNSDPLRYAVFFENVETATAPAQEVVITDELDSDTMELDTFSLGPITFGNISVIPPALSSDFITEVDLRPENDLILRIEARLDFNTEIVTWKFTSLDPDTLAPTDNPLAGFLPPNETPPEGDGSVVFTIVSKENLSTEDTIPNSASIVFDTNSPINTPEWVNTVDKTKPTSSFLSIDSPQTSTSFDISWSGTDAESGIKDYTIYVSEDSGPFNEELTTTGTLTSFIGVNGSTYAFYSRAKDKVGNFEDAPTQPDVTVTIDDPMQEPCTMNTDYFVGVTCFGTTTVANDTQLADYLTDYDYNGTNYKNLYINYNITMEDMEIHSPCDITIASNKTFTGERICIDGRKKVDSASGLTVNGTFVSFISELGDATVGTGSTITANDLLIQGYKTAEIPTSAVVNVDGAILIKSIGNTSTSKARMGQSSTITAGSARVEAVREASTGTGMQLTVEDEFEIISTGTDSSSKAETGISSDITAGSLLMSADKSVSIGNTSTVEISGEATMTSTGSSSTSDVTIKLESTIFADSLNITAGDDAALQTDSEVTVTNNFHMEADTANDCSISGSATITAGSESGNCLQ